jgi:hypothetical protein
VLCYTAKKRLKKENLIMCNILGYGEDAFTLWALRHKTSEVLKRFHDNTSPSECLVFYRPSFGRHNKESSAVFGEFDAIIASLEQIYLIESKWDNLVNFKNSTIVLRPEQKARHKIFSWYLTHWNKEYSSDWENFVREQEPEFEFEGKTVAPKGSLLATNLEFILTKIHNHLRKVPSRQNIKNVLFFFYDKEKSTPPISVPKDFTLVPIDYQQRITGNFISVD